MTQDRKQDGFSLLELMVVAVIVSTLAVVLLNRILRYQEEAERVAMEQNIGAIKSALNMQMAGLIARGREKELPELVGENPVSWLAEPPKSYRGEYYDPKPGQIDPGSWYYDLKDHQLVYLVDRSEHFAADKNGRKWVRYKVVLVMQQTKGRAGNADDKEIAGVVLALAQPYRWF